MRILWLFFAALVVSPSVADQKLHLHSDRELWTNDIFVLFSEEFKNESKIILALKKGIQADIPIEELRNSDIVSAGTLLPVIEKSSSFSNESAREKLGRYLFIRAKNRVAAEAIARSLAIRHDVVQVGIDTLVETSAGCGGATLVQVSESKTWGFSKVRASSAWNYARGHSFVGIADLGSDPNNEDLRTFNGNTYIKGNFLEHLGVDASNRVSPSTAGANPYTGQAYFGHIDDYLPLQHPSDPFCDANGNGFVESQYAGHGTAVTGVIGASAENSLGMKGICRNCPIAMARMGYHNACNPGSDSVTGAYYEADGGKQTVASQAAALGFMLDIGAQVLNISGGVKKISAAEGLPTIANGAFCSDWQSHPYCLILEYADDVDVPIIAAVGNDNINETHFPAADNRVWGVAGVDTTGAKWNENTCGSNVSFNYRPHFAAPAVDIYTTMYPDVSWNPGSCHEYNDGVPGDGFGFCTGTSLATPYISGIVGLVRSVNPLMPKGHIYTLISTNSSQSSRTSSLGWGVPKTDLAVRDALGMINGAQVLNRATPLFELYSAVAEDFVHTTKPQTAVAFARNITWDYQSISTTPSVRGFSYSESPSSINPVQVARAAAFILTTHRLPSGFPSAKPIYRMRFVGNYGGNPNDADAAIVVESEVSGFKSVGYNMEGMEGYIFSLCSPEPGCIPDGAESFYRAYHASRDDHAVFLESSKSSYQAAGYTADLTKLGYAFRNQHSDADDLIDGFESMLGLNKFSTDSDCDGSADDSEFPLTLSPSSDPLQPNLCGGL